MNVRELYTELNRQIPPSLSCEWDNDGLMLLPNAEREVHRALITLDVTPAAARRAVETGCEVIVSHHPLIFKPVRNVIDPLYISLIKADTAVMSFHTRLDAVDFGVNAALAARLGLIETQPITDEMGAVGTPHTELSATDYALYVKHGHAHTVRSTGSTCCRSRRRRQGFYFGGACGGGGCPRYR